jgi:hypothetical protein
MPDVDLMKAVAGLGAWALLDLLVLALLALWLRSRRRS